VSPLEAEAVPAPRGLRDVLTVRARLARPPVRGPLDRCV